ncbi:MAG TPA: hypothetical protein VF297_26110 [Pyrinomonadaceae bacterium]
MRNVVAAILLLVCVVAHASAQARVGRKKSPPVVAKFGGECEGEPFRPSPRLRRMVERLRQETGNPCTGSFCEDYAFRYDLDGDGRDELFVRLNCGMTGNCLFGIFDDYPARSRGVISAWFFYVHRRAGGWSALTSYGRMGGMDGVVHTYAYRRGKYVETSQRLDEGYYQHSHPFLERMGIPDCS